MFEETYFTNVPTFNLTDEFLQTSEGRSFIKQHLEQFLHTITFFLYQ